MTAKGRADHCLLIAARWKFLLVVLAEREMVKWTSLSFLHLERSYFCMKPAAEDV